MRKFISERNLVIVLFVAAFIVFSFAQQETAKQERLQSSGAGNSSSSVQPEVKHAADNIIDSKDAISNTERQ